LTWELHYSRELVQQVLTRPDLAAMLRPKGCEAHPLVLDPANPTNNVAAAVCSLDRLRQLAAADLSSIEGDLIMQLQQQVDKLCTGHQAELEAQRVKTEQLQQEQSSFRSAMLMQQRILGAAGSGSYSCKVEMPVKAWLPSSASVVKEATWNSPPITLQVCSLPAVQDKGHMWAGIELRLAAANPGLTALIRWEFPVPITVLSNSTVALKCHGTACYSPYSREFGSSTKGVLEGTTGLKVWLNDHVLRTIGLYDEGRLKQHAQQDYVLEFNLTFQLLRAG